MKFHAPTGQFTINKQDMAEAARSFLNAIRHIREINNLPLTPYDREGLLEAPDYAMKSIIDGAAALNIDLGANWGNELDVRKAS